MQLLIKELIVKNYQSSYVSKSNYLYSIINITGDGTFVGIQNKLKKSYYDLKSREVQFLIPFSEYVKQRLGIEISNITLRQAEIIIKYLNMYEGKPFILSFDEQEASMQINDNIYKRKKKILKVKKR